MPSACDEEPDTSPDTEASGDRYTRTEDTEWIKYGFDPRGIFDGEHASARLWQDDELPGWIELLELSPNEVPIVARIGGTDGPYMSVMVKLRPDQAEALAESLRECAAGARELAAEQGGSQ